jgi:CheY-like chemotaxis protein
MTSFLYVEDDAMSRQVLEILLKKMLGYEQVILFEDSTDFMSRLRALKSRPDVIFLDIHMEPYNGYEVLEMLRADPAYADQCVVAMTAGVMASDVELLQKAGFDGMIAKPIRKRAFPDLLERILAGESVWFTS